MCPFVIKQHVKRITSIAEALRVLNVYICPIWDDSAVKTKDSMFLFQPTFSAFNGKSFTLLPSDTCFPSALTYTIPPSAVKLTRTSVEGVALASSGRQRVDETCLEKKYTIKSAAPTPTPTLLTHRLGTIPEIGTNWGNNCKFKKKTKKKRFNSFKLD